MNSTLVKLGGPGEPEEDGDGEENSFSIEDILGELGLSTTETVDNSDDEE